MAISDSTPDTTQGECTEIFWLSANPKAQSRKEAFWSKVDILGEDECWAWKAGCYKRKGGAKYGAFKFNVPPFTNNVMSHRVSFLFTNGFLPIGNTVHIRHLCNNPICCNPKHLAAGTAMDNAADRLAAGTSPSGDNHYSRKEPWRLCRGDRHRDAHSGSQPTGSDHWKSELTEMQVIQARTRRHNGESVTEIAKGMKVSRMALYLAVSGVSWKSITDPAPVSTFKRKTPEEIREIYRLHADGIYSKKELASLFGLSVGGLRRILLRNNKG